MLYQKKKLCVCFIAFTLLFFPACKTGTPAYWPTEQWQTSTPEAQGIDSAQLVKMLAYIEKNRLDIDSILIIRNGYIVLDVPIYPFDSVSKHHLYSCTKSVVSTLIGIAIDKKFIRGVQQPVLDFFPEKSFQNMNEEKGNLLLEHLLTMSTGLKTRDNDLYGNEGMIAVQQTDDWVQYILDLPMTNPPGEVFDYSNLSSFLLSAIIQKATGVTAREFAEKNLYDPLGIKDYRWRENPQGITLGYSDLWLHPRDLAKIGYLFLNRGKWENTQIVSAGWVAEATKQHIRTGTFQEGYGYQWWIKSEAIYMALGHGGQYLFAAPEKNLVAVITSHLPDHSFGIPDVLFKYFIHPAFSSDKPLAENNQAREDLKNIVEKLQNPPPPGETQSAEIAALISEKEYILEENDLQVVSLIFFFNEDNTFLKIKYPDREETIEIGPGNQYAYSLLTSGDKVACKGNWEYEGTFCFSLVSIGNLLEETVTCIFEDNKVRLMINDRTNYHRIEGEVVEY